MSGPDVTPYDALLLVSFGGPEHPEDVVPFLENVTSGRGIPQERLQEVGAHYYQFGGRSPINDLNRELLASLRAELDTAGIDVPVYWGNRNWDPYLADTIRQMRDDGVKRAACFITSAYSSYSSCRQYRENLADAVAAVEDAPVVDRLRLYFNHPGFVQPVVDATAAALAELPEAARERVHLAFVTHSIPEAMNESSGPEGDGYRRQHESVVAQVTDEIRARTGQRLESALVYCSRSGSPHTPWLEPDINDHLTAVGEGPATGVVVIPVGFVSDHMEVVYDLDTEARATAEEIGLPFVRAATAGTDARFVAMARALLVERAAAERGEQVDRPARGAVGVMPDRCVAGCCPNPRGIRPALGGMGA